ncbi:MAG: NTP transferase domain-containing protein [Muribaculaceae bacterium]|nr:NTP transferase domain-containing protein [Muribaculaceae bacterium]MDE7081752.1 NTP transferase domain-containing protein [Muribaculaceae bacterium]
MNFGIIAAGEGSRLAQEGISVPKPLVHIQGRPMLERLLRIMEDCGARRIVICTNGSMPELSRYIEEYRPAPGVELVRMERVTPSSMHTFKEISEHLRGHGRFIATTVDTIFRPEDFRRYVEAWEKAGEDVDALMAVTDFVEDEKPLWVAADPADMRVRAFLDRREPGTDFVSGGIYGLSDRAIDVLDDCIEAGLSRMRNYQRALVEQGLGVYAMQMGKILDVDHASDIAAAERFLSGDEENK